VFLDQVNLNRLRVFESVFRSGSMTLAARELHLTQSGVSQHVKSLEETLGVLLFDRIKQKLVPTRHGVDLNERCVQILFNLEQALTSVKGGGKKLFGNVSIGLPIEFGNNLVIPLLSHFGLKHPDVTFSLQLGFASSMNNLLLKGELDFAIVDEYKLDSRIYVEKLSYETLELSIRRDKLPSRGPQNKKFFELLDYVEYEKGQPILKMWFAHHLKQTSLDLKVRATVMDVQGIAKFVLSGLGAGIIPGHLFEKLVKENYDIYRFPGCGKSLRNSISVAYLKERTHSLAASTVLDFLKKELIIV